MVILKCEKLIIFNIGNLKTKGKCKKKMLW